MKTIDVLKLPLKLCLGRRGEKNFRPIQVEWSAWKSSYPNASLNAVYLDPTGKVTTVATSNETPLVIVQIEAITKASGFGQMEFKLTDNNGETIGKSATVVTVVAESISDDGDDSGGGDTVEVEPLNVTENGTYTALSGKAYSPVTVNVPQSVGGGDHESIPSYVKAEAQSVAARVASKMQNDSIVFVVGSDSHQDATDNVKNGNLHGGMAMKALAYILPLDFAAFLGDYTTGSSTTTIEEGLGHISQINADIADAFNGLPQFRTVGNHDPLGYSYSQNGEILTQAQLYSLIGKFNADAGNTMGSTVGGYCYRDFSSKHLRVICLNTAEMPTAASGGAENMTAAQKTWFSQTMASTPSGYGLIILSHHPLDWGGVNAASGLVYDYVNGSSYNADYVLAFHGHTHCFKVDYLNRIVNSVGVPYTVKRIAVPNMCFGRNNEYGRNSGAEYYGIEFGETTTYNKTADSGDDTAFCVMVVNPTEQKVHAICYGAGYDREVYFGAESVAVTGITLNAASGTLAPGATTTLTATVAPSNATNKTVLWSTSNSAVATVNNGTVTAVGVGTATITATTQDGGFIATYALTVEAVKRGNLIGELGYLDNVRIGTSDGADRTGATGYVTIGYFDIDEYIDSYPAVIRFKGADFRSSTHSNSANAAYTTSKGFNSSDYNNTGHLCAALNNAGWTCTFDESGNMTWTCTQRPASNIGYFRVCGYGSGANLDIRVNEEFD